MRSTLINLLLAMASAGTGCASSSANAVRNHELSVCSWHGNWYYSLTGEEYAALVEQTKKDLADNLIRVNFLDTTPSTLEGRTVVCGKAFSFSYSAVSDADNAELCLAGIQSNLSSLEDSAARAYLTTVLSERTGESFGSIIPFNDPDTSLPVSHFAFGMYHLNADSGIIYAAHSPVFVYGSSSDGRVVCVQGVKQVGELEFVGCTPKSHLTMGECDQRYVDFKESGPNDGTTNLPKD